LNNNIKNYYTFRAPLDEQEKFVIQPFGNILRGNRKTLKETPVTVTEKTVVGNMFSMYNVMQGHSAFADARCKNHSSFQLDFSF